MIPVKPETEKAAKRQPVNMCQIASGGAYPVSDTVKSPKITPSDKRTNKLINLIVPGNASFFRVYMMPILKN
ncbi:hypothetical protein DXG60_22200 [Salmonella enterica]|uniref:Uncharacterized protein n=1 Tax=Salmonella enterica TaxID=28901 RepID=A0A3V4C624_SALER|nr:hypothetical protein [Salmonella enterica]ECS7504365.1 hypothetical protein [Salmonella enterica subsp. enterica serovar Newport]ECT0951282.1 hypothetical protein [Salmonella enterica subsp. enterica serovar Saintpaul]EAA8780921.1 hypothetical protein [Salmonella enterica]EAA9403053.1 hypothetical protein [Salmonella enterica]